MRSSDWSEPLLVGLAESAIAYAHGSWCEALLMQCSNDPRHLPQRLFGLLQQMYAVLPASRQEALLGQLIDNQPALLATVAEACAPPWGAPWSVELSRHFVRRLDPLVKVSQYQVTAVLRQVGLCLDPAVLPELMQVANSLQESPWLESSAGALVRTLEVRATMRREFG
jgi:hypothetical protein